MKARVGSRKWRAAVRCQNALQGGQSAVRHMQRQACCLPTKSRERIVAAQAVPEQEPRQAQSNSDRAV